MGTTGLHRPPLPPPEHIAHVAKQARRIRTRREGLTWVQAPGPIDVWIWADDAGAHRATELSFFGRTALYRAGQLTTGLWEGEARTPIPAEAERYWVDRERDAETLSAAATLLQHLPEDVVGLLPEGLAAALHAPEA